MLRAAALSSLLALAAAPAPALEAAARPRVVVLTDIGADPDDAQSLVRLLLYANELEIEGLLATTSQHQRLAPHPELIGRRLLAYGAVRPKLAAHAEGWPTEPELVERVKACSPGLGMQGVGEGHDSEGSDWLVSVVDDPDPRPVWVIVWGGPNCLAQALYRVRAARSAGALADFVAKLRVYTISDQDDSGPWLREEFPGLFTIVSPGSTLADYRRATWSGVTGGARHGIEGADPRVVSEAWLDRNIRRKGPLGRLYPRTMYLTEGDTPSFLYLIPNGLGVPEEPSFGSWGGRYERDAEQGIWTNAADTVRGVDGRLHTTDHATIWRWRTAFQNDFAARMDWSVRAEHADANHPPVAAIGGAAGVASLSREAVAGEEVVLDASVSRDPDGDALSFHWLLYPEAGSWRGPVELRDEDGPIARLVAPPVQAEETVHVVLEVRDGGAPPLVSYRRVVLTVRPAPAP